MSVSVLTQRAVSAFPLSIGTALALESIMDGIQPPYDPAREIPDRIDLNHYSEYWVNVETLHRNIVGSIPSPEQKSLLAGEIIEVLIEETGLIKELVENHTHGRTRVVFYRNLQKGLAKAHPHARLRQPKTENQISTDALLERTCEVFFKHHKGHGDYRVFERVLQPLNKPKALITTHQAYDLLSIGGFDVLDLLESHTGVLKKKSLWYTKLHGGKDLVRIPLNACTMQVFGDSITFAPQPMPLRQQILELSEKFEWHALTTKDRLRFSFDTLKDRFTGQVLKEMLSEF